MKASLEPNPRKEDVPHVFLSLVRLREFKLALPGMLQADAQRILDQFWESQLRDYAIIVMKAPFPDDITEDDAIRDALIEIHARDEGYPTIMVERRGERFHAYLNGDRTRWEAGLTRGDAVRKLVQSYRLTRWREVVI